MGWDIVIGLETHVQLLTKSKIFSRGGTHFGQTANTEIDFVDLGLPGVLPVVNKKALEYAILFGISVKGKISEETIFSRKNYFYPDLPKGYQISQLDKPIVIGGNVDVTLDGNKKFNVALTRAHLEEDAGKSVHEGFGDLSSGIDFNRAGIALLEIVSEPSMTSAAEAVAYAKCLHNLVTWIGICDGNMQEGSFRMDANVSVKPQGTKVLGTRCEIKNLNSFRFLEKAIKYEAARQIELLENDEQVTQQTRLYDPSINKTKEMRSKENSDDYRYFPDPDIPSIIISEELIDSITKQMPMLPSEVRESLVTFFGMSEESAYILTSKKQYLDFFNDVLKKSCEFSGLEIGKDQHKTQITKKAESISKWMLGRLFAQLNKEALDVSSSKITPFELAEILHRLELGELTSQTAAKLFDLLWNNENENIEDLVKKHNLTEIEDDSLVDDLIFDVLGNNEKMVLEYKSGKDKALNALVGQVMKASKGRANAQSVKNKIIHAIAKT